MKKLSSSRSVSFAQPQDHRCTVYEDDDRNPQSLASKSSSTDEHRVVGYNNCDIMKKKNHSMKTYAKITSVQSILSYLVVFLSGAFLSLMISTFTSHSHHDNMSGGFHNNVLTKSIITSSSSSSRGTRGGTATNGLQKRTKNNIRNLQDDAPIAQHPPLTKTLVVYAGPSSKSNKLGRPELYTKNLEYFLRNGIECNRSDASIHTIDTVIVVGHEFYDEYLPWVERLNDGACGGNNNNNNVILISRRESCYDMEAARLALYGGVHGLNIKSYDYFVFVNCGVTGPPPPPKQLLYGKKDNSPSSLHSSSSSSWTTHFTKLLNDQVKMTGLTLNCEGADAVHIQSMVYALDKVGLELVMKAGAIYDCLDPVSLGTDFINGYERKMGQTILNAGYSLRPLLRPNNNSGGSDDGI